MISEPHDNEPITSTSRRSHEGEPAVKTAADYGDRGIPVIGTVVWRRNPNGSITVVNPTVCPNDHPLRPGEILVRHNHARGLLQYTCTHCEAAGEPGTWCVADAPAPAE